MLHRRKGLPVEIDNTDAEGRLVLADALASPPNTRQPDLILFATLTGAARIALGPDLPPLFSDDDGLAEALIAPRDARRSTLAHAALGALRSCSRATSRT